MSLNVTFHGLSSSLFLDDFCAVEQPQKKFKTFLKRRSTSIRRRRSRPSSRQSSGSDNDDHYRRDVCKSFDLGRSFDKSFSSDIRQQEMYPSLDSDSDSTSSRTPPHSISPSDQMFSSQYATQNAVTARRGLGQSLKMGLTVGLRDERKDCYIDRRNLRHTINFHQVT